MNKRRSLQRDTIIGTKSTNLEMKEGHGGGELKEKTKHSNHLSHLSDK